MPNLNKKGPVGQGAMTGQGLGLCSNNPQSADDDKVRGGFGRGMKRSIGRGCCRGNRGGNTLVSLEAQEKHLEDRIEAIRKLKKIYNPE